MQRFQHSIENGIEAALQQHGIQEGDVKDVDIEFEYLL